jgi:hypothetical protein
MQGPPGVALVVSSGLKQREAHAPQRIGRSGVWQASAGSGFSSEPVADAGCNRRAPTGVWLAGRQPEVAWKQTQRYQTMKKIIVAVCCMLALAVAVQAAEGKETQEKETKVEKKKLTQEQKTLMQEMTKKYDTDKDGKLKKDERAKISADDKAKMEKAGIKQEQKEGKRKKNK